MAVVARSTPSFALPATQNTAPVHEFRCLYTHDVRKKAKKWHDGSARFHTFNKRVMVYDDTKSYIGDLHYRADDEFGEGTELQLDRGVLVEVGERVGETQTDLTGILNKPRVEDGTTQRPSSNTQPRPVLRANFLNSQGRPKSLMELLGTPQGRPGRARLQNTSPFEQRQALSEAQPVEPPSKRQKVGSGKENQAVTPQREEVVRSRKERSPAKKTLNNILKPANVRNEHSAAQVVQNSTAVGRSVIDISSDEEVRQRPKASSSKSSKTTESPSTLQVSKRKTQPTKNREVNHRTTEAVSGHRSSPHRASERQSGTPSRLSIVSSSSAARPQSSLRPGMSFLKMRSQPPRQKLMYTTLLPSSFLASNSRMELISNRQASEDRTQIQQYAAGRDPSPAPVASIQSAIFELEDVDQLISPEKPVSQDVHIQKTPRKQCSPQAQESRPSPLFVSQKSPTHSQTSIDDHFILPATQDMFNSVQPIEQQTPDSGVMQMDEHNTSEPESPCFPYPPPRKQTSVEQISPAVMPPPIPPPISGPNIAKPADIQRTPSPKKNRAFARSLSANDSPLLNDPRASPLQTNLPPIQESPRIYHESPRIYHESLVPSHISVLAAPQQINKPSPIKSPFQRSRSDTAAIIPTVIDTTDQPFVTTAEQGAWTKLEAFLLFDKWPVCKEKDKPRFDPLPAAVDNEAISDSDFDEHDDGIGFVPAAAVNRARPVLIRSARSVLRDGQ